MGNYTVYVNPYIVLKSGGYSKHYYIEGQRIVSKLGNGLGDPTNGSKAGNGTVSYGAKQEEAREAIVKNLKFLGQDGSILTAGNSGKTPPGQTSTKGSTGGKEGEQFQYFYHPDHLGSTSYITDASGEVYQHLEYFAFGETFVDEHSNTDRTPYLFNGKELDEETGLYYYGARYYEPQISVWLSVDALTEEYPGLSSYAYVANNPVTYIDPDGKRIIFPKAQWWGNFHFSLDFQRDLNLVYRSKLGKELIRYVHSSKVNVRITNAESIFEGDQEDVENTITIGDSPRFYTSHDGNVHIKYAQKEGIKVDEISAYSFIVLAHELVHAKDIMSGYFEKIQQQHKLSIQDVVDIGELRSIIYTNALRKEQGIE